MLKKINRYFSKTERLLWRFSAGLILISFILFDRVNYLTLSASIIGVTSLIFNAKGNPIGQALMIIFSVFYGIISFGFSYYGEMITYLGMTAPMSLLALISWLRHPFKGKKSEVEIKNLSKKEYILMLFATLTVTIIFYFILKTLNTFNIFPSTVSVATSFAAVFLTYKRSPYFAIAYALNDIVLIILWTIAAFYDITYISVIICFTAFLANDIYGFLSWKKMQKRQAGT